MRAAMQRFSRTCLAVVALLVAALCAAAPASAATVGSSPQRTWQTVGKLDAGLSNVRGRVNTIVYGHGASAGRVFLGGEFLRVRPPRGATGSSVRRLHLAALTTKGGRLIRSWRVPVREHGGATGARVTALALSPNGRVLFIGGLFTSIGGKHRLNAAAVNAVTGKVLPWNPRANRGVHAILVDRANHRVYIGGTFGSVAGVARAHVAAVTMSGGALVSSWHPNVTQETGSCPPRCAVDVHALILSSNGGRIYIGGSFAHVNGVARNSAAAVSARSGALRTWNPDVFITGHKGSLNIVYALDRVGKRIYVCGDFWQVNDSRNPTVSPNLAAVDPAHGDILTSFNGATDGSVNSCRYHGKAHMLFLGGHFDHVGTRAQIQGGGGAQRRHFAAVLRSGAVTAWNPNVNSAPGAWVVATQKHHLAYGGEFTTINGLAQAGFAQFHISY